MTLAPDEPGADRGNQQAVVEIIDLKPEPQHRGKGVLQCNDDCCNNETCDKPQSSRVERKVIARHIITGQDRWRDSLPKTSLAIDTIYTETISMVLPVIPRNIHLRNTLLSVVVCLISSWQSAHCVELVEVRVDVEDGRYHVFGQSRIDASPEFIYATLMDYDNFHKLAEGIADTGYLPPDESGRLLAYTQFKSCVLFFCKTIEKTERIEGNPHDSIHTQAIPELSDFIFNKSDWLIERVGDETILTYSAEFEPDFWIPPLIGPWAVRRKLIQTAELIGMRIEWMYERGLTLSQVQE